MSINTNKAPKNEQNVQNNLITLIGMMGTGKTKFGYLVAKKLNCDFYDSDTLIEKKFKTPIKDLFRIDGEIFFRKVEKEEIHNIINKAKIIKETAVISIGGGAFDNLYTRKLLLKETNVIWLNTPINDLIHRIGNGSKRPMIQGEIKSSINKILKKRIKYYNQCHFKLNTENLSPKEITNQIIKIIL
jgi:shikimate kinase